MITAGQQRIAGADERISTGAGAIQRERNALDTAHQTAQGAFDEHYAKAKNNQDSYWFGEEIKPETEMLMEKNKDK
jgi:hypothetical protein